MAVAERDLEIGDATQDALEHMAALEADGLGRAEAARLTAHWCCERHLLAALAETVVAAGLISLAGTRERNARKGFTRRAAHAELDGGAATLLTLEPAKVLDPADAVVQHQARIDWLEIPYTYQGVQVPVGDMTREMVHEVRATYFSQAKGKLRHVVFLGEIEKRVPAGERVRDALDGREIAQIGRTAFNTDELAQIWLGIADAEYRRR